MNNKIDKEKKYFISYCAYTTDRTDFFNDIVFITDEITSNWLSTVEEGLKEKLQKISNKYIGTQIINIVLI